MINFLHNLLTRTKKSPDDPKILSQLKYELEDSLKNELDHWYPSSLDRSHGGFYTDLNYKFEPDGFHQKTIIHQSRHLWAISRACLRYPQEIIYRECADHGFRFIADKFWNSEGGGFYTELDRKGGRIETDFFMSTFDQSFAIYGILAYHRVSKKSEALKLAIDTFHYLEEYMYDPEHKGYYSYIDQGRNVIQRPKIGSVLNGKCLKGINSILHLLEAYTELYKTWPDPLLYSRLSELLYLIQHKMIQPKGYLHNYFDRDWTPVRIKNRTKSQVKEFLYLDHVSFGHDVEAAFLMQKAAKVLNNNSLDQTIEKTKQLVDHSLKYSFNNRKGGLLAHGYYFDNKEKPAHIGKSKIWWVQAEALYAFLLFSTLYPNDERDYFTKFNQQWSYIKKYFVDYEYGSWFGNGLDTSPKGKQHPKSNQWRATYHTNRALENCIDLLEKKLKDRTT